MRHILYLMTFFLMTNVGLVGSQPNIVIIFNDDMGYSDLSIYGAPKIKTPRVDKLAMEGVRFTSFYVPAPVCSASRAAILTGQYPQTLDISWVLHPNTGPRGLSPKYLTIAEVLKAQGYATMASGKWHLGHEKEYLPTNQGFDEYYGIPYSNDMVPAKNMEYAEDCLFREGMTKEKIDKAFEKGPLQKGGPIKLKNKVPLMRNEQCVEFPADQHTITQRFTTEGMRFITESHEKEKPFFLYLAHSMPHIPLYVSKNFEGKSEGGLYGDVIEEIDYNTGRLLDHLDKLGIAENTIVIFSSDNGPYLKAEEHGGSAHPYFEGKLTHFEGGHRVPAIIRWPAKIPEGIVINEIASTIDLFPTLAQLSGAEIQESWGLHGKNILDLMIGKQGAKSQHEYFFFGTSAVRSGDWKYHKRELFRFEKEREKVSRVPSLYNLKNDLGETTNLINEYPEIAESLRIALENGPRKIKKRKQ